MKPHRTMVIATAIVAFGLPAAFGVFRDTQPVQARVQMPTTPTPELTPSPCPDGALDCYSVNPSDTDGSVSDDDCVDRPTQAIGCESLWPQGDHSDANNTKHYLYRPSTWTPEGKLFVLLGGGDGNAKGITTALGPVAVQQGYHVIGLSYPSAPANGCSQEVDLQESLDCFGDAYHEVVTGQERSPSAGGDRTSVGQHSQDSINNRLLRVLQWAHAEHQNDGWNAYLINNTAVDWTKVHIGGHSNGSSHSSYMGSLPQYQAIARVSLFAGPDDGDEADPDDPERTWHPATYIQDTHGSTGSRYYGLTHYLNKARSLSNGNEVNPIPIYRIYDNWNTFGMEEPNNQTRFLFDPDPDFTPYFGDAHMLISMDPERRVATDDEPWGTTKAESHSSVINDVYCIREDLPDNDPSDNDDYSCEEFGTQRIGYKPAWRCVLGTGDRYASDPPIADAGPAQTAECQGNGGANIVLDGSGTRDYDCELLLYNWAGPFGQATGPNPTAFFPLGINLTSLEVRDDWWLSLPATTSVTVTDTTVPSLHVTLTPTSLWPANHKMVRITATVNFADSCGPAPSVVLTSITSSQPDNGQGDGDTANDIQDAQIGTFDRSFLLRAERFGGDPNGRTYTITYTATDASGNHTSRIATVRVPHSK